MAEYAVSNVAMRTLGDRVAVAWDIDGAPDTAVCYLYLDGVFVGIVRGRSFVFYGDGVHHVTIFAFDEADAFDVGAHRPAVPTTRPVLAWTRPVSGGIAVADIAAFNIYQGDTAGGAVDTSIVAKRVSVQSESDWSFAAVMDALIHGESRRYRISPVNRAGNQDASLATDITVECIGISPAMVVESSTYSSGPKTLAFTLAEP